MREFFQKSACDPTVEHASEARGRFSLGWRVITVQKAMLVKATHVSLSPIRSQI
jgi:hypothetical protein